ncbi:MAG: FAD-binding oxidoreductase [Bacteroidetes bacterium]|nr:MAG: FAD-binding oxidoreductase [Bacteroidota bacterium]
MNEVVKNLTHFYQSKNVAVPELLCDCGEQQELYNQRRQIFNRNFQFKPTVIVLCESKEQVSVLVQFTSAEGLTLRVRSGGHDHEGECTGTDVVLMDLSKMNKVDIRDGYVAIEAGNIFKNLTTTLAKSEVMIPHGTCATVGIAGFTLGGGWGPWTRKHGMCCESVIGATVVLGDGSIVDVSQQEEYDNEKSLLWALKGGGGFSYGIVTEFRITTFPLPPMLIKFQVQWNKLEHQRHMESYFAHPHHLTPTLDVLQAWEQLIDGEGETNEKLVGTNLKISAKPSKLDEPFVVDKVCHNCIMYGYWEGNEDELKEFLRINFSTVPHYKYKLLGKGGTHNTTENYGTNLMSNWDRFSFQQVQQLMLNNDADEHDMPFPPDLDDPAPHKITSRLVEAQGLDKEGYVQLLRSLTSPLVEIGNVQLGLFTYITLGAINGKYYKNMTPDRAIHSSFPYKDRLYTIQYQTWWNEKPKQKAKGEDNKVYNRVNRALDWMDVCRNFKIPNTSGAFISFKDSSIPTKTYFDVSYEKLIRAKHKHSKDPFNHFRSRKTII